MAYAFNREQSFGLAPVDGNTTTFNKAQRFSPAHLTSHYLSDIASGTQSQGGKTSFCEMFLLLSEICNAIPLVSFRNIDLRINNGANMNEYLAVQFDTQGKVINLSFVIQNPEEDEPDVMMLASVKGEGYISRTRSVTSVMQWLSQQFESIHVASADDDIATAA